MESQNTRRLRLGASPLCRGLTDPELDVLLTIAEDRTVPRGAHVFKHGDLADGLFFIAKGHVQVLAKEGQPLALLSGGDVLGELSLFGGGHRRSASARAESDVIVVWIPVRPFRKLLEAWNVAAMKVVCNLTEQLAERFVVLSEKLVATSKPTSGDPKAHVPHWKL
jgi:CRP-like cAMP-binding protein